MNSNSLTCSIIIMIIFAQFNLLSAQDDFEITIEEEEKDYGWKSPAGAYLKPTSFFSLHGYVNGVFGSKSDEWTNPDLTQISAPGQLLVPNTNESSFQYDAALVIGSELSSRARVAMELHLVSNPSGNGTAGPGGLTIAMTEATASYDILPKALTFSGGLFWAPFGIVNRDWLGAQNNFSLVPRASAAIPVHFNERGIRLNGVFDLSENAAMNYVFSIGNGLNGFSDIRGQNSFDANSNKTTTGRIGVFPGLGKDLELGASFLQGSLRDNGTVVDPADAMAYGADLGAFGMDIGYRKNNFEIKSYLIKSKEKLSANGAFAPEDLTRSGFMTEIMYLIKVDSENLYGIMPKLRVDRLSVQSLSYDNVNLSTESLHSIVYSLGVNIKASENFIFSFDYNVAQESGQADIDNNRFFGKITANF